MWTHRFRAQRTLPTACTEINNIIMESVEDNRSTTMVSHVGASMMTGAVTRWRACIIDSTQGRHNTVEARTCSPRRSFQLRFSWHLQRPLQMEPSVRSQRASVSRMRPKDSLSMELSKPLGSMSKKSAWARPQFSAAKAEETLTTPLRRDIILLKHVNAMLLVPTTSST